MSFVYGIESSRLAEMSGVYGIIILQFSGAHSILYATCMAGQARVVTFDRYCVLHLKISPEL